eukprot:CAMPEP_0198155024 /NCGR_PEP_ID=MMETSP1443-20131203/68917_1 /TAXON_ID=186043 /ORGANISM="Entomoneis sp., Strain CCMP2396" /LENGTH=421 /DNA_ID=CAMNT_0043821753 /DNA_START=262 /DNA_END=1528 /DNA_ORIENTATION=+
MGLSSLLDDASKALRQQEQQEQQEEEGSSLSLQEQLERENIPRVSPPQQSTPVRIAYAISITHCNLKKSLDYIKVTDGPAVLAHSIHLNSVQHAESKSKYDYQLYAFVHPEATNCSTYLSDYNYTVKVLDTPFDVSMIKKEIYKERIQREEAGCCKEKEFLKLYSYTLQQHPIVVHLDADCLILKPLDDLFDAMLLPDEEEKHLGTNIVQWPKDQMVKRRIHSFFTRDYPMGNPTMKVEHFGVQGGFWIVRPNLTAFEEFKHLIIEGNFSSGWYDADTKYPGFYGAAMIQGLVGFFYGHIHPNQAVELNRCSFNNMAEDSWDLKKADVKFRTIQIAPAAVKQKFQTFIPPTSLFARSLGLVPDTIHKDSTRAFAINLWSHGFKLDTIWKLRGGDYLAQIWISCRIPTSTFMDTALDEDTPH